MGRRADFSLTASPGSLLAVAARAERRAHRRRGRPQLPRRLRRRDGHVARALPSPARRGRAAAGRRALVHVPLLVPQRPDARARRGAALGFPARGHVVLLQLLGLRVGRVGDPARPALLAAARASRQDRPDLALAFLPRLDARRALALGLEVAGVLRARARQASRGPRAERRHPPAPRRRPRRRPGPRASSRTPSCAAAPPTSRPS